MDIILNQENLKIENYSALVAYAKEQTAVYEGLVVEESAVQAAKKDTAELRKQAKAADRIRIDVKKANELRIKEVTDQLLNVAAIFNGAAEKIDAQVKAFEQKAKEEKRLELEEFFHGLGLNELIGFSDVFDEKMLNKTYSIEDAKVEIETRAQRIDCDIKSIMTMEDSEHILGWYLECKNLYQAIQKSEGMKALLAGNKVEPVQQVEIKPSVPVIDCRPKRSETWFITATDTQFEKLVKFCAENGIEHRIATIDGIEETTFEVE